MTGLTNAKNYGIQFCESEFIHFFDDDLILDNDYFELIQQSFISNPEYFGICGRQKNSKSSKFKVLMFSIFHFGVFQDIRKKANSGYITLKLVPTKILPGGITAYRRELFEKYLFDEVLIKYCQGEDMDFSFRVSQKFPLAFCTEALALHNHSQTGRYNVREAYAAKVVGYHYFYNKNIHKNFVNLISLGMVNIGVILDALNHVFRKRDLGSLIGVAKGYFRIKNNYKNVPFIDYNKYILGKEDLWKN